MSPEAILDPLPIDRSAKAAAWDAVQSAQSPDELQQSMDALPLPTAAKAALWDVKAGLWQAQPTAHFSASPARDVTGDPIPSELPTPPPTVPAVPPDPATVEMAPTPSPLSPGPMSPTAAPQPKPQPVANTSDFLKAHNVWKKAITEAATKFMQEHPGTPYEAAEQAISGTAGVEPKIDDFRALSPAPDLAPPSTPEPAKPSKVSKVSPATPIPPTAALPTEPESPATIALQISQLGRFGTPLQPNQRKVVMFPGGQGMPDLSTLAGLKITHDGLGNVYAFRPDLITPGEIRRAAQSNKLPEILGGPLGMGAPDKSAIQAPQFAVTGRAPGGVEAQTTVTDAPSLAQTVLATHAATPAGGTLEIKSPQEALTARQASSIGLPAQRGVIQPQSAVVIPPQPQMPPPGLRPAMAAGPPAPSGPQPTMLADGRRPTSSVPLVAVQGRNLLRSVIAGGKGNNGENNPSNQPPGRHQPNQPGTGTLPNLSQGNGSPPLRGFPGQGDGAPLHGEPQSLAGGNGVGLRRIPGQVAGKPKTEVRRITGSSDIPLTGAGQQQALQLTRKAVVPFNAVVSAPNTRATQTAGKFGAPSILPSLDGWARGIYEGQPSDRVKAEMADLMMNQDKVPPGVSPISGKPGQSWAQMAKTMFADVRNVATKTPPENRTLMVTSGGNLQALDAWGKAGYPSDFEFPNDKIAAQPYWSVTGKMFRLGQNGLQEVQNNRQPGLYFIEHGETAYNSKGEKSPTAVTREEYRQIADFPKAMQIYDQATDPAKRLLFRDARDRAFAAKYKPEVWTAEAKQVAGKHFNVAPVTVRKVYQGQRPVQPASMFPTPPPIQ